MTARVYAEELMGRKWREKVLLGEGHVWFGLEAKRVEPSEMSADVKEEE